MVLKSCPNLTSVMTQRGDHPPPMGNHSCIMCGLQHLGIVPHLPVQSGRSPLFLRRHTPLRTLLIETDRISSLWHPLPPRSPPKKSLVSVPAAPPTSSALSRSCPTTSPPLRAPSLSLSATPVFSVTPPSSRAFPPGCATAAAAGSPPNTGCSPAPLSPAPRANPSAAKSPAAPTRSSASSAARSAPWLTCRPSASE